MVPLKTIDQTTNYEAMVAAVLTDAYGEALSYGDGPRLSHRGLRISVQVVTQDGGPWMLLVARVAVGVVDRARAAIEVALLNRSNGPARWVLDGDDIYLAAAAPVWPLVSGHLTALVRAYVERLQANEPDLLLRTGAEPTPRELSEWHNLLDAAYVPLGHDADRLRDQVGAWLEQRTGEPQEVDEDGDFEVLASHGGPVWITPCEDRAAVVIFARVVAGVSDRRTAAIEAALVTDVVRTSKWYVQFDSIWQRTEVPVEFFFVEHLDQALDEFLSSSQLVRDDLALRTAGSVVG